MVNRKRIHGLLYGMLPFLFIFTSLLTGCAQPDVSQLVYSIDGKESAYPRLSKDGNKILYQSNAQGHWQLMIMDRMTGTHTPVLPGPANDNFPDWSDDNQWIAFTSDRDGNEEIYLMRNDGTAVQRITNHPGRDIHPYFSPDGRYLLFNSTRANESFDIYRYTLATGELKQLSDTPENKTCARYSPDMKLIVYLRNNETSDDVFMADSLNRNPVNISNDPLIMDGWPMFSHDNKKIFWSSMESGSYCVYSIHTDRTGKTKHTSSGRNEEDARVSVSRDGKSFIYNKRKGPTIEIREIRIE